MKKVNLKEVMQQAWKIAREGVAKFGGKVKEYFAEALKIAWELAKGLKNVKDVVVEATANDWMKYGKHRLYIEVKMQLVELKEVAGQTVGALRRLSRKMYYDWKAEKMVCYDFIGQDLSRAADDVVKFMKDKIMKAAWSKVEAYRKIAASKEKAVSESL
jgi:hypothetical protein